jgi:hypothetical protein
MNWVLGIVALGVFVYTWFIAKPPRVSAQEWDGLPTAEEGVSIAVVFGTVQINSPNITWFGDVGRSGLNYYAGAQFGLCHGEVDWFEGIAVGGKSVWSGYVAPNASGVGFVNFRALFGALDEFAGKAESRGVDGVEGLAMVRFGAVNNAGTDDGSQGAPCDYLTKQMQMVKGPQYHGVCTVELWRPWLGNSPSLKPFGFRVQRIHKAQGGDEAQWYDAKAEIRIGRNREEVWKYKVAAAWDATDYSAKAFNDSAWTTGQGGFGNAGRWNFGYKTPIVQTSLQGLEGATSTSVPLGTSVWVRQDIGPMPPCAFGVRVWNDGAATLWCNGTQVTLTPITDSKDPRSGVFNARAWVPASLVDAGGVNVLALRVVAGFNDNSQIGQYVYAGLQAGLDRFSPEAVVNMNGVHVVYEVLTNTTWGLGYAAADVDWAASFMTAASTCYAERLGVSFLWSAQTKIEEFLSEVLRHIGAVLYVDRTTGKFTIKLIRNDFDVGDLLVLNASNIARIENAERPALGELVNSVTATYSRVPNGDPGTITVHDNGLIAAQGAVIGQKVEFQGLTDAYSAQRMAFRNLRALSRSLLSCALETNREASGLNVGDPFVLNWPNLDINNVVMRVTGVELGDGISNAVKIKAAEDVFYTADAPIVLFPGTIWPPVTLEPLPGTAYSTRFTTVRTEDPLNRGVVFCTFLGPHFAGGNTPVLEGWTEDPPGVFAYPTTGPLDAEWFDDVDPGTDDHSGVSPMLGKAVLVWTGDTTESGVDEKRMGVFLVEDVGGHWVDYGLPSQTYVSTYPRLRRHPDYDESGDFVEGMTVQVQAGTAHGGHFFTLANAAVTLGATEQEWAEATTKTWAYGYQLLTPAQLAEAEQVTTGGRVSPGVLDEAVTMGVAGADFTGFETLAGTPGVSTIPAGPWRFPVEGVWLDVDAPAETTTIGFKVYRVRYGGGGGVVFEVLGPALHNTDPIPLDLTYNAPSIQMDDGDVLALIPTLHTSSATPVTLNLRYSSPQHGTGVTMPAPTAAPLPRATRMAARHADGVVIVSERAIDTAVTVAAGTHLVGFTTAGYQDGDSVSLTVNGGTAGSPVVIEHLGTAPTGSAPFFLGSISLLGATYGNLQAKTSNYRITIKYDKPALRWYLIGGPIA